MWRSLFCYGLELLFTTSNASLFTAEHGYLPKCFKARSKYGTPTAGIITNTLVIIAFGSADFGQLLELLNCTYAISLLMEYAAFVKLRIFHKDCKVSSPVWVIYLLHAPRYSPHV